MEYNVEYNSGQSKLERKKFISTWSINHVKILMKNQQPTPLPLLCCSLFHSVHLSAPSKFDDGSIIHIYIYLSEDGKKIIMIHGWLSNLPFLHIHVKFFFYAYLM